ncbi:hypothetical protein DFH06DRAFT_1197194, partial [Mycena polygramma]
MPGFSFPLELERDIFETAAARDRNLIPTLLRVCRRVHVWVEPLLYTVIDITGHSGDPLLAVVESKPATLLKNAVRHAYLPGARKEWNMKLLSICSEIENFCLESFDSDFFLVLDKMRLRKLDLTMTVSKFGPRQWTPSGLTRPMFLSITDLSLDIHGFHPIH